MTFSIDNPYQLLSIAHSLDKNASESTILLISYVCERFGMLGTTLHQFPDIPHDQFDSVVRDDFEPRLLQVASESTEAGESLIQVAVALKQFYDQLPLVKSAAENLEHVLQQSTSPADWKAATEPLARSLSNLYSVEVPQSVGRGGTYGSRKDSSSAETITTKAEDGNGTGTAETTSAGVLSSPHSGKKSAGNTTTKPGDTSTSPGDEAAEKTAIDNPSQSRGNDNQRDSEDDNAPQSNTGSPSTGGNLSSGGGADAGGTAVPASGAAAPAANASTSAKKPLSTTTEGSPYSPAEPASTYLQSADFTPAARLGSGGIGGASGGGAGIDSAAKHLGLAPGGTNAAGAVAAGNNMTSSATTRAMMGGMMGGGFMNPHTQGSKERKTPDYLYSADNGYELIEKLPVVSPEVVGALNEQEQEEMELITPFSEGVEGH